MKAATRVTRRRVLLGGAAVAALGSAGVAWIATRSQGSHEWIEAVVRRNLWDVRLDPDSLGVFATRLAAEPEFGSRKVALAVALDDVAPALFRLAPEVQRKIARLERIVMSRYLLSSNFFRVADPRVETIVYGEALPACGNPFAVFRGT